MFMFLRVILDILSLVVSATVGYLMYKGLIQKHRELVRGAA